MDGNTSIWSSDNYDPVSIKLCVKKLKEEFGQQFSDSQSILEQHTHTMTIHESELPNGHNENRCLHTRTMLDVVRRGNQHKVGKSCLDTT